MEVHIGVEVGDGGDATEFFPIHATEARLSRGGDLILSFLFPPDVLPISNILHPQAVMPYAESPFSEEMPRAWLCFRIA